ncbi:MAG: 50S ribosomal protein L9 [Proteobacteria bacterium]|nr:50S ribosomal protein L9 [Pseudomonadota bacterium]
MEIILLERVEKLGLMGDIVTVKDGYARNFLLPRKKALRATAANQKVFDSQKKDIEAANLKAKKEADAVAKKMEGVSITLLRQAGETGQLYGSVSSRDIAASLGDEGFKLDRNQVTLDRPIKEIGISEVTVRLHPEVTVSVKVNTARSVEEAEMQAAKGGAVSAEEIFETKEFAEAAEGAIHEAEAEETASEEAAVKKAEAAAKAKAEAASADEDAGEDAGNSDDAPDAEEAEEK